MVLEEIFERQPSGNLRRVFLKAAKDTGDMLPQKIIDATDTPTYKQSTLRYPYVHLSLSRTVLISGSLCPDIVTPGLQVRSNLQPRLQPRLLSDRSRSHPSGSPRPRLASVGPKTCSRKCGQQGSSSLWLELRAHPRAHVQTHLRAHLQSQPGVRRSL